MKGSLLLLQYSLPVLNNVSLLISWHCEVEMVPIVLEKRCASSHNDLNSISFPSFRVDILWIGSGGISVLVWFVCLFDVEGLLFCGNQGGRLERSPFSDRVTSSWVPHTKKTNTHSGPCMALAF